MASTPESTGAASIPGRATDRGWMAAAECRHTGPALFHDTDNPSAAKEICARCTVRAECLAYALATRQPRGVWGGLTPRERRRPDPRPAEADTRRGPARLIGDAQLAELFTDADPDRPALGQLRARVTLSQAGAYAYLNRARELGLVERRGRGLYPARR